jgi:hypothetical protein
MGKEYGREKIKGTEEWKNTGVRELFYVKEWEEEQEEK